MPKHKFAVRGVFLTSLTLNLLPGPASRLLGSWRELFVGACLAAHLCEPITAKVLAKFAIREGF